MAASRRGIGGSALARQFDAGTQDKVWVTDITDIRTQKGFAYLAVAIDLHSRRLGGVPEGA